MTETEFWGFLRKEWGKGKTPQVFSAIRDRSPEAQASGRYIQSHAMLPRDSEKMPLDKIVRMSSLLFKRKVKRETKEAVMIILAHHRSGEALSALQRYSANPDRRLKVFAEMALDECEMWHDESNRVRITEIGDSGCASVIIKR